MVDDYFFLAICHLSISFSNFCSFVFVVELGVDFGDAAHNLQFTHEAQDHVHSTAETVNFWQEVWVDILRRSAFRLFSLVHIKQQGNLSVETDIISWDDIGMWGRTNHILTYVGG